MAPDDLIDEGSGTEQSGSQSDRRTSLSTNRPDVLGVNQLLESVKMICSSFLKKHS
jgi:protein EFR3